MQFQSVKKNNWQIKKLEEILDKVVYTKKIPRKEFLETGELPVVSQEMNLINGFWNDDQDLFKVVKPLVVFGDHTKIFKYIDFDFVLGADGVKILKPKNILDSKFFYYQLLSLDLKDLGYARHYRILKEKNISFPESITEQKRIVKILDEAFEKIEIAKDNTEKNLQNAKELFESYLYNLNGDKQALGSVVDIKTGKLNANAMEEDGQYPFFTCAKEIFAINNYAFDCEAILLAGNNAVGDFNVKHYKGKFNAYQRTYIITVNKDNKILYRYLYFQLLNSLKEFKGKSVGTGTKFLKLGMIKDLEIVLPTISEQKQIVTKLDTLSGEVKKYEAILHSKIADLDEFKKSILKQAFEGEL